MSFCVISAVVLATACSPEGPVDLSSTPVDAGPLALSGYVLKGPVSGATVTAYKLHADLTEGDTLASATTDESGFFGLELPAVQRRRPPRRKRRDLYGGGHPDG